MPEFVLRRHAVAGINPALAGSSAQIVSEEFGASQNMLLIAHRVNTVAQLAAVPTHYGVELDLRDRGDRLILQHDPFQDGEDFAEYLSHWRHRLMILNVKSERIEPRVLELVKRFNVRDYFFLDCSFPMIRQLVKLGERRVAVRFSEFEPVEAALALAGQIDWAWVDCFTQNAARWPDVWSVAAAIQTVRRVAGTARRPAESIADYARQLAPFPLDAVCTKRPDLWLASRNRTVAMGPFRNAAVDSLDQFQCGARHEQFFSIVGFWR